MEEDESKKRNTDCVYFLASPLTCKKGSKCEFRHSESARRNPRECYYWLNGSCINPSCGFRHPPLDGVAEPVHLPSHAATPTSKSSVPCYFYFNAYCIKGDHCPFLHDTLPAQKSLKALPDTITTNLPEKKASTGSDTGPASVEVPANLHGGTSEPGKQELSKEISRPPAPTIALEEMSPSAESSVPEFEEPPIKLSDKTPLPPTEYGSPQICLDQVSEEIVKECAEPDEWWESSPGFDVLVDDGSKQLPYDDDADYILAREPESEIHRQLLQYDYEVPAGYDPTGYLDDGYMYDHDIYNHAEKSRNTPEYFQREDSRERRRSSERSSDLGPHRKRRSSRKRHMVDERNGMDLRDHLRKRRRTDGSFHKRMPSRSRRRSRERSVRQGTGPLLDGRVASEVGNRAIPAHDTSFGGNDWGGSRYPKSSRYVQSRLLERESRLRNRNPRPERASRKSSKVSQGSSSRMEESSPVKAAVIDFSGPKSLAQIKEEKRRATATESKVSENYAPRHPPIPGPNDFVGPKPLNEILKGKRSVSSNGLVTKEENHGPLGSCAEKRPSNINSTGYNEDQITGHESDFLDDEDVLRKKTG
ncbi:zinc finger CCCH domain-containing protein 34-like [Iris pallida]|uniref:Zinc finger CCCH domain-containing protein 34-like n=1 Tax=Iris pallida TaxID=29817 RepID=A0AAX6GYA7_IRIPA|nr:zinc finger CCCH domain-containing protein 34-like [Iris pallida]